MKMPKRFFEKYNMPDAAEELRLRGFSIFNLNLTQTERRSLQGFPVKRAGQYDNFADGRGFFRDLKSFLTMISCDEQKAERVAGLIKRVRGDILSGFSGKTCWTSVRSFCPTDEYDKPRWHQDGLFYPFVLGHQFKIAAALKGPSTLFSEAPVNLREEFKRLGFRSAQQAKQNILNDFIKPVAVTQPRQGEGGIFEVAVSSAAIHSEPPVKEERPFISFVPGTGAQIESLRRCWGEKKSVIHIMGKAKPLM